MLIPRKASEIIPCHFSFIKTHSLHKGICCDFTQDLTFLGMQTVTSVFNILGVQYMYINYNIF